MPQTANFDLRLFARDGAHAAEVLDSPAGQTAAPVPVAGAIPAALGGAGMPASGDLPAIGQALWRCAFGDPAIAELWRSSRAAARSAGLRLRLSIESPELAALPWELLYDATRSRFLALDGRTPVVRFTRLPLPPDPWPQDRPLRLLFTGASPGELPLLDLAAEWAAIQTALAGPLRAGRLTLDGQPEGASLAGLLAGLRQGADIWHFAGHGDDAAVFLTDRQGRAARADAGTVGQLLCGEGVRLAVLNACRAGAGGGVAASVAGALLRAEIPAVVALQGPVSDEVAGAFASGFYAAIADGQPVDRAVTSARKAILALGALGETSWWLPALFMRAPDGVLWQPAETVVGSGAAALGSRNTVVAPQGDIQAGGHVIITGEGATVVIGEAPVVITSVDRQSALGRYLQHSISRNRYLQLQGIRAGGRLVHIELDRIYVRLRATQQQAVDAEQRWLAEEATWAPGEWQRAGGPLVAHDERPAVMTETVTVAVEEALAQHSRLVVLGDPGSGKTTLLSYLALLYARDLAEKGTHLVGDKLGLREIGRLPLLLALRQIGAFLHTHHPADDGTDGHALLLDFLARSLENERLHLPNDFFDAWLEKGNAVILLDGLDEVADPELRRRVSRLVESFTRDYPKCRYVVTSRIVGHAGPARLGENYVTTTVRDFSLADVEQFLTNWHRLVTIGQMGPGESADAYAANQTRQLLGAIRANQRIRELAINPLMLTVIAMVHRDRVKLPDRRAELYAEAVDVLLGKWEAAKGLTEPAVLPGKSFDTGDRRLVLQSLALHMHEGRMKEIAAGELAERLAGIFADLLVDAAEARRAVERFLGVIQERTGLLVARGEGVYAFSHLTFQEYLAALAVAARDDYIPFTLARMADAWWREVVLLEAGYLSTQSRERTTGLIRAITGVREEPEPYHNLVLAADCVRDVGSSRVQGDLEAEIQRRLRKDLVAPPPLWARWTKASGARALVDRRSKVMEALVRAGAGYWTPPHGEPEWVPIPSGEFWMGEPDAARKVSLPEFAIARAPITNAQYYLFVRQTGYAAPDGWDEGQPPRDQEGHPVVSVSWEEALAYCRWLSQVTGKPIALPSEAQWEKAARGDRDKRAYPWGDTFEATRCNSRELGVRDITPVGIFPDGASPYGVLDMSGNVWEWCRTGWRDIYMGQPNNTLEGYTARVLRGGAFGSDARFVRCACRLGDVLDDRSRAIGFRVIASPIIHDSGA